MDRRSFLKLSALLPFSKQIIKNLFETREAQLDQELNWNDPDILYNAHTFEYDEQMFAPSLTKIGAFDVVSHGDGHAWGEPDEFIKVGRTSPLLYSACPTDFEVQIKTGHCDESENLLDL